MRIAFMGTPDFALPALDALVEARHDIACVYTQPPRPAGRGKAPRRSPVQQRAEALGLPVASPVSLRDPAEQAAFTALELDAAVVAAYGLILPQPILDAPRHGCLNIHASLLPRWRGAAPIQRAILAGDDATGVTIMQMERGLDTGPMRLSRSTPVDAKDAGGLTAELAAMGAAMMVEVLADLAALPPVAQPDGATLAPKVDKAETRLDWSADCAQLVRQVRAFSPGPGAWFEHGGERVRVLAAQASEAIGQPGEVLDGHLTIACASGAIRPLLVQRAGRGSMTPEELLRGFPIPPGTRLA